MQPSPLLVMTNTFLVLVHPQAPHLFPPTTASGVCFSDMLTAPRRQTHVLSNLCQAVEHAYLPWSINQVIAWMFLKNNLTFFRLVKLVAAS
ncbi:hypothetical protein BZA77DRAFT_157305 [Pyronema omphalodes]|nr:hypothetical protein BZA77DRAFT_157305 [Pyronema omphalodes]